MPNWTSIRALLIACAALTPCSGAIADDFLGLKTAKDFRRIAGASGTPEPPAAFIDTPDAAIAGTQIAARSRVLIAFDQLKTSAARQSCRLLHSPATAGSVMLDCREKPSAVLNADLLVLQSEIESWRQMMASPEEITGVEKLVREMIGDGPKSSAEPADKLGNVDIQTYMSDQSQATALESRTQQRLSRPCKNCY